MRYALASAVMAAALVAGRGAHGQIPVIDASMWLARVISSVLTRVVRP